MIISRQINEVINFGCRLNDWESNKIRKTVNTFPNKNLIIINTCAVTKETTKQIKQKIRKLKKLYPKRKIILTGCGIEADEQKYKKMEEVSSLVKNKYKLNSKSWAKFKLDNYPHLIKSKISKLKNNNSKVVFKTTPANSNYRRYVKIQSGCNHNCTFCIIPKCRGKSKSTRREVIINEIKTLVNKGVLEIILTGVDLTSWGNDFNTKMNLGSLVKEILVSVKDLKRLRLSSVDAAEFDNDLLESFSEGNVLMPHVHFSLQSHDDIILKRMKRRHLSSEFELTLKKLRNVRPDITIGADFIAGFPTESNKMFLNSFSSIRKLNITHLHVFPYSERPNTIANRMPQNPIYIRKKRAKTMRMEGLIIMANALKEQIGKPQKVLIENQSGIGRTEHYFLAKVDKGTVGKITEFIPTHVKDGILRGKQYE